VVPSGSLEGSAVLAPSTAPRRGASLRSAPFGVTCAARGALPAAGRDEGMVAAVEPRDGQAADAGGNSPPLDGDLVGNSKNAVGMIAPKLLQPFCERCRAPRIGFLLLGNVAEMDTKRINRPEPVHRLGCRASAMSRVWRGM
jgi:hypothetical protein